MKNKDVIIIGGGFVGLASALTLSKLGLTVGVLTASTPTASPSADGRAIALAYTSVIFLKNLGVYPHIEAAMNPIDEVITSDQGYFNKLRIRANELNIPYLGQICPAPILGEGLMSACHVDSNIEMMGDTTVTLLDPDKRTVHYMKDAVITELKAKLIVCCDGADSGLAKSIGYTATSKSYQQTAWVANISISLPHKNTAIERFTQMGTLALLPLKNQRMTAVLSLPDHQHAAWLALDADQKLNTIQVLLGDRFGKLSDLGKSFEYPLKEVILDKTYQTGVLFLGNAVHTVNPIAAQGLNLSFRDLSVLSDIIKDAIAVSQDIGGSEMLANYNAKVKPAHQSMLRLTDFLVFISKHKFKYARSLALGLLNTTLAKGMLAKTLAGLSSHRGTLMDPFYDV